jgi:hypothetical protein
MIHPHFFDAVSDAPYFEPNARPMQADVAPRQVCTGVRRAVILRENT